MSNLRCFTVLSAVLSAVLVVVGLARPPLSWGAEDPGEAERLRREVKALEARLELERLRLRKVELQQQVETARAQADAAEGTKAPTKPAELQPFTNSVGMEFVPIPAGTFEMGCGSSEPEGGCYPSEKPRHRVTISQPFYLGKHEVTQAQWREIMGNNPSHFKGDDNRPVECVSWDDIQEFIKKLNAKEGTIRYRLPTEAEWEYAARAGSKTAYSFGNDASQLGDYAWYGGNSGDETHPVGQKRANAWGLHDMHGNVWEWVQDWWQDKYDAGAVTDPQGPSAGGFGFRVLRGGGWLGTARVCRSAGRHWVTPGDRVRGNGFRLARSPGR